jgi:hypothetical protein
MLARSAGWMRSATTEIVNHHSPKVLSSAQAAMFRRLLGAPQACVSAIDWALA